MGVRHTLNAWTALPQAGEARTRAARDTLRAIALTIVCACVVVIVALAILVEHPWSRIAYTLVFIAGVIASVFLAPRFGPTVASATLLLIFGAAVTAGIATAGSIATPATAGYPVLVMATGLLLGSRSAIGVAVVSAALIGGLGFWQDEAALTSSIAEHSAASIWWVYAAALASATAFVSFGVRSIQQALTSAETSQAELATRNSELEAEVKMRVIAEASLSESEERYRALVEHSDDLIAEIDERGRILFASPRRKTTLGYPSDSLVGLSSLDLVHPGDREHLITCLETLAKEGVARTPPLRMRHADGRWRWIETSGAGFIASEGDFRSVTVSRDVTSRRDLERQLRESQKLEAVARLAGGIAHDFNNLLTVVAGHTETLLHDARIDDGQRSSLTEVQDAAARASSLVRQLFAFARKESRAPQTLELNEVVRQMAGLLGRLIGENVELVVRLSEKPLWVEVDRSQLEQILANLAVNARDAMSGPGRLIVQTDERTTEEAGRHDRDWAVVSASDTGIGMSEETRARIFEPFFTTKEQGQGTGLGLSTVHGIVEQSGGRIEVESELGIGTTFRVSFPRVEGRAEELPKNPDEARLEPPGSGTVLLVEDDAAVRRVVRHVLEQDGYDVIEARDGIEALDLARNDCARIDLLLTDVVLPRMGGIELREALRSIRPTLPALLMSGYHESARGAASSSDDELLWKPFRREELSRRIRGVLRTSPPS